MIGIRHVDPVAADLTSHDLHAERAGSTRVGLWPRQRSTSTRGGFAVATAARRKHHHQQGNGPKDQGQPPICVAVAQGMCLPLIEVRREGGVTLKVFGGMSSVAG